MDDKMLSYVLPAQSEQADKVMARREFFGLLKGSALALVVCAAVVLGVALL